MARFEAFRHVAFRRYFVGQVISSVGSWLQAFAVTWLVLDLTGRSDRLGVAVALQFLPLLLFGAPAGVLADRVDNRRLLMATSVASGLVALAFGVLLSAGLTDLGVVYGLTFVSGLVLAVERPAMQALLSQLVPPASLGSAVATNSTIASVSRLVGPALGGLLATTVGLASCFYANAISYVAVFAALAVITDLAPRSTGRRANGGLREAVAHVRHRADIRRPLLVMVVIGLVVLNFPTTFPSLVRFEFESGAGAIGTVMSVSAVGSILGGVYAAGIGARARSALPWTLGAFGVVLTGVALAPSYAVFVLLSVPLGFVSACFQSLDTIVVQQATEPAMQGRVMALHQMAWFGSTPIGALLMGWVVQSTSARVPFVLGSIAAIGSAVAISFRHGEPAPADARPVGSARVVQRT